MCLPSSLSYFEWKYTEAEIKGYINKVCVVTDILDLLPVKGIKTILFHNLILSKFSREIRCSWIKLRYYTFVSRQFSLIADLGLRFTDLLVVK